MPSAEHLQNIDEQSLLRLSVSRGMCGKNATRRVALHFWPGAEGTAQIHQLAQMVGVVIRKDQRFAQYRLALAMRDFCEEIGARVLHQANHVRQIFLESGHTIVPGLIIGRHGSFWPVAAGKIRRDVLGIPAEFEDVALGDARVFEQLPTSVREGVRERPVFAGGKIVERVREMNVRSAAFQQVDELFAQFAIGVARGFRLGRGFFDCFFLFHAGFSDRSTFWGIPATGCELVFAKPELANIFSYSENV